MGEVLGIGLTHAPHFQFPDENMADILRRRMRRADAPREAKDPALWPEPMRREWGDDEGLSAAKAHRETLVSAFRRARAALDEFNPDFVLVWGDDQYENFQADCLPPFCVYAFDALDCRAFELSGAMMATRNVWGEPNESLLRVKGHRSGGGHIARELIGSGFDVAYAAKLLHADTLSHAFMRTIMYLDYDRKGFDYPMVPFHVNCYGADLAVPPGASGPPVVLKEDLPTSPPPWRCYDLGKRVREIVEESDYRVALIGSSSWSHAFLTKKFPAGHPDVDADRQRFVELSSGRHADWRNLDLNELRASGQHEMLNWICLAGAMEDRTAEILAYGETYIFNSDKCVALFPPTSRSGERRTMAKTA